MDLIKLFESNSLFSVSYKFQLLVIGIILWVLFTIVFKFDNTILHAAVLFGLIIFILNYNVNKNFANVDDTNKNTMYKLYTLQEKMYAFIQNRIKNELKGTKITPEIIAQLRERSKLDSMYMDATLIHFLHSVIYLYDYNPDSFYKMVKGVNNILKIKESILTLYEGSGTYPENCFEMYEQAEILKTNVLNYMHSFIYTVPKTQVSYEQLSIILTRFQQLLKNNLHDIANACDSHRTQMGVNTRTKFIHRFPAPKPNTDTHSTTTFHHYN